MVTLTGFPAPLEPISAAWELRMTLSEIVKYLVLAVSISLLLLALGILAWQIIRCCSHTHTRYTQRETVNNDLMFSEEKSSAAENYSGAPSTKTVTANAEAFRLSRYFSLASYPSSASSQSDGETGEKVDGSLRFSVFYDQQQTQLVVTVLQAEGLFQDRPTRSLHPFVKIRLMFAESTVNMEEFNCDEREATPPVLWTVLQEWRTRVVKGSCSPLFGDQFTCILQEEEDLLRHISLRMEVRDYDKFSRHTVLGEVRVPLERLHSAYPLELQEALQTPQKDLVGKLLLSLKFLPTSQRLEVGLLKIRTVLTQSHSNEALYARVTVQSNQSKLPYQKTSAVPRCSLTVFNKVLIFSLPEFPVEQCKVLVYVYESHTSKKSSKRLIGQLIVGKERSSEDEHWSLMMRSVRQPVAKWHSLLI
ncbi:synaptotagmin-2 isoform X2 [Salarias fasciatus]|uniref:Synaptotagmin-2-like n=1 Tax=Salarias fasciatus TaxID=181472 RepID=A0A672HUP3_SALFA|nr:synaptotagmin-2-like isoform X2 [Salarias fasciatus]